MIWGYTTELGAATTQCKQQAKLQALACRPLLAPWRALSRCWHWQVPCIYLTAAFLEEHASRAQWQQQPVHTIEVSQSWLAEPVRTSCSRDPIMMIYGNNSQHDEALPGEYHTCAKPHRMSPAPSRGYTACTAYLQIYASTGLYLVVIADASLASNCQDES